VLVLLLVLVLVLVLGKRDQSRYFQISRVLHENNSTKGSLRLRARAPFH
jgi:hypothetical protein